MEPALIASLQSLSVWSHACILRSVSEKEKKETKETTMKSTLNSLLVTAAGVVLSTAGAYGQMNITANIPFEFLAAAGVQPAGQYALEPAANGAAIRIVNQDTRKASLLGIGVPEG